MMKTVELINKRILVVGLGLTGLSVARYLSREGIVFELADEKTTREALNEENLSVELHSNFTADLFCTFDIIVLSPGIPRAHPSIVAALAAGADVIGDIELFADAVQKPVIAVTGSNGKSTVVAWLADALNACGIKALACGNIGKPALDSLMEEADVRIVELSSYQLESTRSLRPLSAAVLNVSDDHLDRYDDIEHYAAVKRSVYENATNCVANKDDARTWPAEAQCSSCTLFSLEPSANDSSYLQRSILGEEFTLMPGEHNVANALALVALAAPLGVAVDTLIASLTRFMGLEHRSQFVAERNEIRWYNDSKGTNVDACEKAIRAMPGPVVLIAGGLSKGADFTPLRAAVTQHVKLLVLIGQDRQIIADQLFGCATIKMVDTLKQAVDIANQHALSGDAVLLSPACASFDMFKNFEDRGEQFIASVNEVIAA